MPVGKDGPSKARLVDTRRALSDPALVGPEGPLPPAPWTSTRETIPHALDLDRSLDLLSRSDYPLLGGNPVHQDVMGLEGKTLTDPTGGGDADLVGIENSQEPVVVAGTAA